MEGAGKKVKPKPRTGGDGAGAKPEPIKIPAIAREQWYGAYEDRWVEGVDLVADAFKHPAKCAKGLGKRIVEEGLKRGWWHSEDTVKVTEAVLDQVREDIKHGRFGYTRVQESGTGSVRYWTPQQPASVRQGTASVSVDGVSARTPTSEQS